MIHRTSHTREASSSSSAIRYLDWNSGLVVSSEEQLQDRMCSLQDIGGHIMKIPIIGFQVLLCMRLEVINIFLVIMAIGWDIINSLGCLDNYISCFEFQGTPAGARNIPLPILFSPLFVLQGAGVLFAASRLVEKLVILLRGGTGTGRYFAFSSRVRDCFGFLHHGSR